MSLPTPYYEHAGIVIYRGSCQEILPFVQRGYVLLTDPPYGVELGTSDSRGDGHGLAKVGYLSYEDTTLNFETLVVPILTLGIECAVRGAVFVGKRTNRLPNPACIGGIYCPSAVGRNPFGFTNLMAVFFYGHDPTLFTKGAQHTVRMSTEIAERNGHPCPKPLGWMKWLVGIVSELGETIVDPFMGSGTTLLAAKQLGRRAIGIEIEERYCEIAVKRLAQEVLPLEPPSLEPEQTELLDQ